MPDVHILIFIAMFVSIHIDMRIQVGHGNHDAAYLINLFKLVNSEYPTCIPTMGPHFLTETGRQTNVTLR